MCWLDRAAHRVNGELVHLLAGSRRLGADGTAAPLTGGRLQVQSEGAELFVRDIAVEALDAPPPESAGTPGG